MEAGELVIMPTSRWYMICCDAGDADACARIFAAKQRPIAKSMVLVAPSMDAVRQHFRLTAEAELLADALWPGDMALLLPWRDASDGSRYCMVGTPWALVTYAPGLLGELAARASCLIAATTANLSVMDAPGPSINLAEVREFIAKSGAGVSVAVDGGICPTANHLTIVRCADDRTELVREGVVHTRAVMAALHRPAQA
ncbi:L-threonylcarbamoyladenylate synthase [Plantactinospora sp. CA-294935]|uniref:L-threonylcarbamoyladenylate synthase n=1 Tax=Plantactinospora sp. CA-294935 TaxID=3240012 RepID=UPI003D90BAFA